MTRSHPFRSTALPRVALAAVVVLMAGLSAPPAAAQTAAQVSPSVAVSTDGPLVTDRAASVRRAAEVLARAEEQRAAEARAQADARAKAEQARAEEAARVKLAEVEQYLAAAAAHDAELARQAAARAEAERVAAERAAAERAASRRSSGSLPGGFAALRRCESGGNYGAVNSSGTYRGAYQFSRTTWNSVAASSFPHLVGVDPAAASPADQDAMAQALYRRAGAGQWPVCGRHL